jgi:hypothetical protein
MQENSTAAGGNSTAPPSGSNSGRIMISAEYAVINQTIAAIEDDVLTLSLAGGFESRHPINFTIVMPPASQLRYVANYGSGTVVLGPGECQTARPAHVLHYAAACTRACVRSAVCLMAAPRGHVMTHWHCSRLQLRYHLMWSFMLWMLKH